MEIKLLQKLHLFVLYISKSYLWTAGFNTTEVQSIIKKI